MCYTVLIIIEMLIIYITHKQPFDDFIKLLNNNCFLIDIVLNKPIMDAAFSSITGVQITISHHL